MKISSTQLHECHTYVTEATQPVIIQLGLSEATTFAIQVHTYPMQKLMP